MSHKKIIFGNYRVKIKEEAKRKLELYVSSTIQMLSIRN